MIDTGKDGIYRPILKGERVPTALVVRMRDEKLRVVGDDYIRWQHMGPSLGDNAKLADLRRSQRLDSGSGE